MVQMLTSCVSVVSVTGINKTKEKGGKNDQGKMLADLLTA